MIAPVFVKSFGLFSAIAILSAPVSDRRDSRFGSEPPVANTPVEPPPAALLLRKYLGSGGDRFQGAGRNLGAQSGRGITLVHGSPVPTYPDLLVMAGMTGIVVIDVEIDTTGIADTASLKMLVKSHQLLANSVQHAIGRMRFTPAVRGGRKVREKIRAAFRFNVDGQTFADTTRYPLEVVIDAPVKH